MTVLAFTRWLATTALMRWWVGRRASAIVSPVERLRFLQTHQVTLNDLRARPAVPVPYWVVLVSGAAIGVSLLGVATWRSTKSSPVAGPAQAAELARVEKPVPPPKAATLEKIWVVDTTPAIETYSNGLRVEKKFATTNRPRAYYTYNRNQNLDISLTIRNQPAGIVFHTTESHLTEFTPANNRTLRRYGESLIGYVRDQKAYNYVIDRFGRVFRVVEENEVAFHAGHSTWADDRWVYLNLNDSFIGVAFETQTVKGDENPRITSGQMVAGRLLTDMLRAKYDIAATNCPTHAQVSVNPQNMIIGYHTDWAGNFPYEELGLPDNYAPASPAVLIFGFAYDPSFMASTGARMWKGLLAAEDQIREQAKQNGRSVAEQKAALRERYKKLSAPLGEHGGKSAEGE
ncbi:MAG: N-acetylmuramoyl-L-alanine amidase [Bryobacteraceae bacterium]|nr:N-acetylmuramoyl-L-alanine amidase [Bryobacteraceae bacterium]